MFGSNLLIILIAVVVVVLFGIGLALIFSSKSSKRNSLKDDFSSEGKITTAADDAVAKTLELDKGNNVEVPQDFGLQLVLDDDQVFELSLPTTIGRSAENSVEIPDSSVSEVHARIFFDPRLGAVCIQDLNSLNGIFVDGRPTRLNVLDDGARLTIGGVSLTFRDTGYLPPTR